MLCSVYCTDCDNVTVQEFVGLTNNKRENMYVCLDCGCENYEPVDDSNSDMK